MKGKAVFLKIFISYTVKEQMASHKFFKRPTLFLMNNLEGFQFTVHDTLPLVTKIITGVKEE